MLNRAAQCRIQLANLQKTKQNKAVQGNTNPQWAGQDSNLRSLATTGLQPVPFNHSGTDPKNTRI
jgi:hypothetical protein